MLVTPALLAQSQSQGQWQPYPHLQWYDQALMRLMSGQIQRLAVNLPPRHGKSLLAKWFIVLYLGVFSDREVIVATASKRLARSYGHFCRDFFDEFGPSVFGVSLRKDRHAVDDFRTTHGGGLLCGSVGSALMGHGASLIVLDDLYGSTRQVISATYRENTWRWLGQTLVRRLAPNGVILNLGSRQHADDVWGRYDLAEEAGGDRWDRLIQPAINDDGSALWPEWFPLAKLNQTRASLEAEGNLRDWQSQYLLKPPQGDGLSEWPSEYFDDIVINEPPQAQTLRVLALDPSKGREAKQGDYAAWTDVRYHDGLLYVQSEQRRVPTDQIEDITVQLIKLNRYDAVIVETNGFQALIASNVLKKCQQLNIPCPLYGHSNTVNKIVRIRLSLTPLLNQRRIRILPSSTRQLLINQLKFFPYDLHDDGPDSLELATQALNELLRSGGRGTYLVPVKA